MPVYIQGLKLKNYCGIGVNTQTMAPFKELNFFIGANNSGKSSVLNFISRHIPIVQRTHRSDAPPTPVDQLETYGRGSSGPIEVSFGFQESKFREGLFAKIEGHHNQSYTGPFIEKLVSALSQNGFAWLKTGLPYSGSLKFELERSTEKWIEIMQARDWKTIWIYLTQYSGGDYGTWISGTIEAAMSTLSVNFPQTKLIPAIREITSDGDPPSGYSGRGLINRLAEIQNPEHNMQDERDLFMKINRFLQTVIDDPKAQIEVPFSRSYVSVHMNGQVLPLSSLGTGIHEVIMLAAYCTFTENQIMCIEEPEIHLHPILQRKFIKYIQQNTNNQYFIATHSASFIDTPGAAIFHVSHDGEQSFIRESILKGDRYAICIDLGHRASDIVQANAVIWVEGPSERIYIKHWLSEFDRNLEEGIHYSIMFYGGRLLNHLSADDDEVNSFISLRFLNQNLAVIMDSDKNSEDDNINGTKARVIQELEGRRGIAWLTQGREIENYVRYDLLQEGLSAMYKSIYGGPLKSGQYEHSFYFRTKIKRVRKGGAPTFNYVDADKVKLARWVCDRPAELDVLDLRERIEELAAMIRAAND